MASLIDPRAPFLDFDTFGMTIQFVCIGGDFTLTVPI